MSMPGVRRMSVVAPNSEVHEILIQDLAKRRETTQSGRLVFGDIDVSGVALCEPVISIHKAGSRRSQPQAYRLCSNGMYGFLLLTETLYQRND